MDPPGSSSNGFNENLTLFENGRRTMWIDATVAAGTLSDARQSQAASSVGYAPAPIAETPRGSQWLWFWALAVPSSSRHEAMAVAFIEWATSKQYIQLVAQTDGWAQVPPGTRQSTYRQPLYLASAPFADFVWSIVPLAMTLWFSFRRYNLLEPDRTGFDGLGNYRYLLTDPGLLPALGNTVILSLALTACRFTRRGAPATPCSGCSRQR